MVYNNKLEDDILTTCIYGQSSVNASKAVNHLSDEDFTTPVNKSIFRAICRTLKDQESVNMTNILHYIEDKYMDQFVRLEALRTVDVIDPLIMRLKDTTRARGIISGINGLLDKFNNSDNIADEITELESKLLPIFHQGATLKSGDFIKNMLSDFYDKLNEDIEHNRSEGIKTGIELFDKASGGLRGGEQIVIAGRSGMGKSSFALSCMVNQIMANKNVALFSLEMSEDEIIKKLHSMVSDKIGDPVPYYKLRNPYGVKGITEQLTKATNIMYNSNLYLDTNPRITMGDIRAKALELKYENKLDILYIDHIGLMPKDKRNERAELTEITNEGKRLAKELDIPVVLISQLNRTLDKGGRPTLSDLKGSGSIEEDANTLLFIWRQYVIAQQGNPEDGVLIVAKARNSETVDIPLEFSTETTFFKQMDLEKYKKKLELEKEMERNEKTRF